MAVQLFTGKTGVGVTSASDRRLYAGMFGTESYVHEIGKMCAASLDGPNKLVVQNGSILHKGAHIDLLGNTEFTIPSGLQAQKRATLCGVLYTAHADGTEEAIEKTYTGSPVADGEVPDPEYPDEDIFNGGTQSFMPLYRVVTDGINTLEPEPLFKVVVPYSKFRDSQYQLTLDEVAIGKWIDGSTLYRRAYVFLDVGWSGKDMQLPSYIQAVRMYGSLVPNGTNACIPLGAGWTTSEKIQSEFNGYISASNILRIYASDSWTGTATIFIEYTKSS